MSVMSDSAGTANEKALISSLWEDLSLVHSYAIIPKLYWDTVVTDTLETTMKDLFHMVETLRKWEIYSSVLYKTEFCWQCIRIAQITAKMYYYKS